MRKGPGNKNLPDERRESQHKVTLSGYYNYFMPLLIFLVSGFFYYFYLNYVFFYQENLSLFVFSGDYLQKFSSKPGGLLEYAGNFLSQCYFNSFYGTLILASVFTAVAIVYYKISKKLSTDGPQAIFSAALAACILILIQANINFQIHNSLGILLAGLFFLFSLYSEKRIFRILTLVLFPLFLYIAGAYAWIFLGMSVVHGLSGKKILNPLLLITVAGISLLFFKEVVFLQSWKDLLYYPMPLTGFFNTSAFIWLLLLFFVLYPAFAGFSQLIKPAEDKKRTLTLFSVLLPVFLTILLLSATYNRNMANLFEIEKMFIASNWNGVIRHQEESQSENPVAQYYYNVALSESGLLCDRLFFTQQLYGSRSMSIAWNDQVPINKLFRGVYFYYSIGLVNEAHRWAFESMVIQGYRPENIKMLIKTNLINGHYKVAEKYIAVLKKTLHYHNLALKYEAMTLNPDLIMSDPELGEKMQLKPKDDFIVRIRNPLMNIDYLLQSNPTNRKAFEYDMACLMLDKNVPGIINILERLPDMNYQHIPRYIEEAVLLIQGNLGPLPLLTGIKISEETRSRFSAYIASLKNIDRTKPVSGSVIPKELRNTFWYYIEFVKSQ